MTAGWAPSTFVSSRKQRAQRGEQRAEDFMDEEDLAEQADGQRLVARASFAGQGAVEQTQAVRRAIQDAAATDGG